MIDTLNLRFGSAVGEPPLSLKPNAVTIFVGPNNSGKSQLLREITSFLLKGEKHHTDVILESVEFKAINPADIDVTIESMKIKPRRQDNIALDHFWIGKGGARRQVHSGSMREAMHAPNGRQQAYATNYVAFHVLSMGGHNRGSLIGDIPASDLQDVPMHPLDTLFRDDEKS